MVLFVSMLYASAMPLLIWVGAAYFGLVSLSHKWEVPHRLSLLFPRRPPPGLPSAPVPATHPLRSAAFSTAQGRSPPIIIPSALT